MFRQHRDKLRIVKLVNLCQIYNVYVTTLVALSDTTLFLTTQNKSNTLILSRLRNATCSESEKIT